MPLQSFEEIFDGVSLCWKHITYSIQSKNLDFSSHIVLNDISGYVKQRSVLCILGESGSGKTSLIEILCGIRQKTSGSVYYNGKLFNDYNKIRKQNNFCYISQDIILPNSLNISECLSYTAALRNISISSSLLKINEIISSLNLNKCCNTIIGNNLLFNTGISFGEKKRGLFGIQMLSQPSLLFLDEILSGLDSINAYNIFSILNDLKNLGHSIIISIHQPSLKLFNLMKKYKFNIMLIHNGKNMYFGSAQNYINYFTRIQINIPTFNVNPIDYLFDIIHEYKDNNQYNYYKNSEYILNKFAIEEENKLLNLIDTEIAKEMHMIDTEIAIRIRNRNVSLFNEILILINRTFRNDFRNLVSYWTRLMLYILQSIICGLLFYNISSTNNSIHNRIGYLLYVVNFLSLMSLVSIYIFMSSRQLFIIEKLNNTYSPFSYCISSLITSIPWNIASSISVTYILCNLVQSKLNINIQYYILYFLNCFLLSMSSESIAIIFTALSSKYMIVFTLISGSIGTFVMFAGALILKSDIPSYFMWIYYISYYNYSFKIFMILDFKDELNEDILIMNGNAVLNGNDVLDFYQMNDVDLFQCYIVLIAMILLYRIVLFYLFLKFLV